MIPTGETQSLSFRLNGQPLAVEVPPATSLLDLLRGLGGLTSVRAGCRIGRCGACTVLLDGRSVPACLVPAWRLEGAGWTPWRGWRGTPTTRRWPRP